MPTDAATGAGSPAARSPGTPVAARYDALLVDLDGVVYRGDERIPAAPAALRAARDLGVPIRFLTNNSARTPEQVARRLQERGVDAEPGEIVTSALATGAWIRGEAGSSLPAEPTAFVIGERGVREALEGAGVRLVDGDPDRTDLVVMGWDRGVDYPKLRRAALLVQRGARLVATNADATYPAPDGLWPGGGAILAAVTTATGAEPTVIGKPHRPMFAAAALDASARRPLVVGDRLDTDVAGASRMGWDSLLVLTGASTPADLVSAEALPTYVGRDLGALARDLPRIRTRPAEPRDAPALAELLSSSGLSSSGVSERLRGTLVAEPDPAGGDGDEAPAILATACLVDEGGEAVLRSVAVHPAARGSGIGLLVAAPTLRRGAREGRRRFVLFTETAPGFFERLGFQTVGRDDLPAAVRDGAHAREECAETAVPMLLELDAGPPPEEPRPGASPSQFQGAS